MKSATHKEKRFLLAHLLPLAENCPIERGRPADCPLSLLSQRKPAERARYLSALNEDELGFVSGYCHVCANTKLTAQAGESPAQLCVSRV